MVEVGWDLALVRLSDLMELAAEKEVKPGHFSARQKCLRTLLSDSDSTELIVVSAEKLLL